MPPLLCCLLLLGGTAVSALRIAADSVTPLDGAQWIARSTAPGTASDVINASVPGEVITDLYTASRIPYPFLDLTWREQAGLWDLQTWTYERIFDAPPHPACAAWLVLEGVKMAADVSINGVALGAATDQHLRVAFDISAHLLPTHNVLAVAFPPTVEDSRNDQGRFMGSSGGWDWAAYSNETTGRTPKGIRTFSKGITDTLYIARVCSAAITHVKALVFYEGPYPTEPLTRGTAGPWTVNVTVYLSFAQASALGGVLTVIPSWDAAHPATMRIALLPGTAETAFTIPLAVAAGVVELWWPTGLADLPQTLYNISVAFTPDGGALSIITAQPRTVGFRTIALVTSNDSDPSTLAGVRGSGNLTMRLRVNGASMFLRGSNWIPLEGLEAHNSATAQAAAVASAAAVGMNCLRVWGGGVWPPDAFLDAADEVGVLLYVDAMYASQADSHHFAAACAEQDAEIRHNIRRIASHPSVALLDACNECGGSIPFSSFVAPLLAEEDPSRPLWPASPSQGWEDGVDRLWGRPIPGVPLSILTTSAPTRPVPGMPSCTQQAGAFAYGFPLSPFLDPLPVADAAACCALCAAKSGCALANYADGGCQLVEPPFAELSRSPSSLVLFPAGSPAAPVPIPAPNRIEQHGPYFGGGGWPTVNGHGSPPSPFAAEQPPSLPACGASGVTAAGTFTSEFGVGQPASFESMSPTLSPTFYGMLGGNHPADTCTGGFAHVCTGGNPMAQRNYACSDAWVSFFPLPARTALAISDAGAAAFALQLYLCQLATALKLKSLVEGHRATNIFGLLTWQLGEQWSTYGWGSLEYSSGEGAVLGGRWKPSHYLLAHGYATQLAACGVDARCFVKSDDPLSPFEGTLNTHLLRLRDGMVMPLASQPLSLPRGAGSISWLCAAGGGAPQCNSSSAASSGCMTTPDMDVQGASQGDAVPAADAAACCAACASAGWCTLGVFFKDICYLKGSGGSRVASPGRVLCAPSPPPTPPCAPWTTTLTAAGCAPDATDCLLILEVVDAPTQRVVSTNEQLLTEPGRLILAPSVAVDAAVGAVAADGRSVAVTLNATGPGPALFVTLFTLANGRFSENVLTLLPGTPRELAFLPFVADAESEAAVLRATLRVNHLAQLLVAGGAE